MRRPVAVLAALGIVLAVLMPFVSSRFTDTRQLVLDLRPPAEYATYRLYCATSKPLNLSSFNKNRWVDEVLGLYNMTQEETRAAAAQFQNTNFYILLIIDEDMVGPMLLVRQWQAAYFQKPPKPSSRKNFVQPFKARSYCLPHVCAECRSARQPSTAARLIMCMPTVASTKTTILTVAIPPTAFY